MHIVTTHKGTDFDALASVVAANLLYPDVVTIMPGSLNPNVHAFLSLHKDLFDFCTSEEIDLENRADLHILGAFLSPAYSRIPVVDKGKIVGIFSRSDAVADLYGLCPLGNGFSKGCKQKNRWNARSVKQ